MQQSFFVLSGQHIELARDEVISIAKSYDSKTTYSAHPRLVITRSSVPWEKVAKRATFVRTAGKIVDTFTGVSKVELPVPKPSTFACRTINLSSTKVDSTSLEREAGAVLKHKWGARVSLASPALTVYLILTDNKKYLGYADKIAEPKRPSKPFKYPHELDWKLSRAMVNLSKLKEGKTLCDPFCGTGTILLEAESMGMHCIGIDFDSDMCDIAEKNLAKNGYDSKVINSTYHDIRKIKGKIDAIVTDVPYGIASKSSMSPKGIIQDFLSVVPRGMKLVMVYKKGLDVDELAKAKKYEIYRHKSLTRVIAVR